MNQPHGLHVWHHPTLMTLPEGVISDDSSLKDLHTDESQLEKCVGNKCGLCGLCRKSVRLGE